MHSTFRGKLLPNGPLYCRYSRHLDHDEKTPQWCFLHSTLKSQSTRFPQRLASVTRSIEFLNSFFSTPTVDFNKCKAILHVDGRLSITWKQFFKILLLNSRWKPNTACKYSSPSGREEVQSLTCSKFSFLRRSVFAWREFREPQQDLQKETLDVYQQPNFLHWRQD